MDTTDKSTNQIAELQTRLVRHEQSIALMDSEVKRANQERNRMSTLVNTLQKELTAKDLLIKKAKLEAEKYRVNLRNKDLELSSLVTKVKFHSL